MLELLLHELGHIILYFLVVLILKGILKKDYGWKLLIYGLGITLLIDLDHLFDYLLSYGLVINLPLMLSGEYFRTSGKIYIPLHSWELVVVLLVGYLFAKIKIKNNYKVKQLPIVSSLAISVHLVFDILYYGFNPLVYFAIYRILHGSGVDLFKF